MSPAALSGSAYSSGSTLTNFRAHTGGEFFYGISTATSTSSTIYAFSRDTSDGSLTTAASDYTVLTGTPYLPGQIVITTETTSE